MDREPPAAVEVCLIVKLLKNLCIKHSDNEVVGLVGIRNDAEQRCFCLPVPVHANAKFRKVQVVP